MQCLACCFQNPKANRAYCWGHRSREVPFSLGVPVVCLPKLVGKTLPMFASNASDDCLRFRKKCLRTLLRMLGSFASDG